MSGVPTANEILKTIQIRDFIQFGGPRPTNAPAYYGANAQYMIMDNISIPESGAVAPVWVPDPRSTAGRYKLVARTIAAPSTLPKSTLTLLEKHGFVPRQLGRVGIISVYENVGQCKDPSNFLTGWSDGVLIYELGIVETKTPGKRGDWKVDSELMDKLALTLQAIYPIGALGMGEKDTGAAEYVDITYGSLVRDGSCGPQDDGTQTIYALTKHASAAKVRYSLDGGSTWADSAITGIGAAVDPDRIVVMGTNLVVTSSAENAIYVNSINQTTGAPGASWTKVTTGIVAAHGITDIWVANNYEAYACGLAGYLYKIVDPSAGATVLDAGVATTVDLHRIRGQENQIVAVGATHTVVASTNRGQSWAKTATDPGAGAGQAIEIVQPNLWWYGDGSGGVYESQDGGVTWTAKAGFTGLASVKDIRFATPSVGWIGGATSAPLGQLWATWNGGNSWTNSSPRIQQALTVQAVNTVAIPDVAASDPEVASDNVALACLGDTGTTGAAVIGAVARL